ncbi:hypothetical protein [Rufibacter roseus]|uniref:Lipoprotein n=1 Tax=Rufibacter roseus TaxID=1567108 RepID=A0ABW2DKN7_9BACT|nr:hypothetical protein [Rufibacter roseus]
MKKILLTLAFSSALLSCNNDQKKAEEVIIKYEKENLPYIKGYESVAFDKLTLIQDKDNVPQRYRILHKFRIGNEGYLVKRRYHLDLALSNVTHAVTLE